MQLVVQQSDNMMDNLRKENDMLKEQLQDMTDQVTTKADADDEIMVKVNLKVEEWKSILADKDDKIIDLQHQVMQLREQLIAANMDTEKRSVAVLQNVSTSYLVQILTI